MEAGGEGGREGFGEDVECGLTPAKIGGGKVGRFGSRNRGFWAFAF